MFCDDVRAREGPNEKLPFILGYRGCISFDCQGFQGTSECSAALKAGPVIEDDQGRQALTFGCCYTGGHIGHSSAPQPSDTPLFSSPGATCSTQQDPASRAESLAVCSLACQAASLLQKSASCIRLISRPSGNSGESLSRQVVRAHEKLSSVVLKSTYILCSVCDYPI